MLFRRMASNNLRRWTEYAARGLGPSEEKPAPLCTAVLSAGVLSSQGCWPGGWKQLESLPDVPGDHVAGSSHRTSSLQCWPPGGRTTGKHVTKPPLCRHTLSSFHLEEPTPTLYGTVRKVAEGRSNQWPGAVVLKVWCQDYGLHLHHLET